MFAALDRFWSGLAEIGVDPSSTLRRDDAVSALQETFAEVRRVGDSIQSLISEADQRIGEAVSEAQNLMERIASLNDEIRLTARSGADSTGAENAQAALIDQLSAIMDVRVSPLEEGGVHVRSSGGALLVGVEAAQLSYTPNTAPFAAHGVISFNSELGTSSNIEPFLLGGQLHGLLQVRDEDLAGLAEAVGGFAGALSNTLNEIHNENASTPAVSELVGRQTGLIGSDSLGFTGTAIVGIVDSDGNLAQRLTINFGAGTITGEAPGAVYNIGTTITSFTNALDFAMGAATPAGGADFTGGVLSLTVGASGGVVVQQDPDDPSARAGRGFSHFFGLNDLISRPTPSFFENGVDATDRHGLAAGGQLVFQVRDASGRFIADRTITISGALAAPTATWGTLVGALNANGTGLGGYGTFSLDAATGKITLTSAAGFDVEMLNDSTTRGATGVSVSALHGMSSVSTAGRAMEINVNDLVAGDPGRLAVARPDLTVDIGDKMIENGDNRGASALAAARNSARTFAAAGLLSAQTTSLSLYAARLGGEAGRLASDSQRQADGAEAVATAAADRRAQIEGVSLDDELIRMTTFQNSYAAAARVIQAATEMLDILLAMGIR